MRKKSKRKIWTPKEIAYLREHYPCTLTSELAKRFDCKNHQVYNKAHLLGLKKDKAFLSEVTYQQQMKLIAEGKHQGYQKGRTPENKGKKMSPTTRAKVKHTWYQKGHRPHNWKPVGSQRINKEGYLEIKTQEPRTWELLHRKIWRDHHGDIPARHNVVFRNRDRTDCRIENLELISDEALMRRNTIIRYPIEIQSTIRTLNKLKRKIKEHEEN